MAQPKASKDASSSFEAFYTQHRRGAVFQAMKMVDRHSIAEEIAQEAFGLTWNHWEELADPVRYLRRTISNRCRDELRRRRSARNVQHLLREPKHHDTHYLLDVLAAMAPNQRTALFLRYFADRSTAQIAKSMGVAQGTAKSHIHRGIIDLRASIELD